MNTTTTNGNGKEKMIDKIRKLLALASSPNENEAAAANEKAQALLLEYNLSMSDVGTTEDEVGDEPITADVNGVTSAEPWRRPLANAIAQMYFCKYVYVTWHGKDTHTFIGTKVNAEVTKLMFDYLHETVNRLARAGARSVPKHEQSPYRVSFRAAATRRLCIRIYDRIQEAKRGGVIKTEGGNMLPALLSMFEKANAATAAFMQEKYGKNLKTKNSTLRDLHSRGTSDGHAAGGSIGLDPQVRSSANLRLK
jgi:hypothetical protein